MGRFLTISTIIRLLFVFIFLFWFIVVWKYTRGLVIPPIGDYQRDTAIIFNILQGNILGDAAYLSEYQWYPILYHLTFAFCHNISGISVLTLIVGYPFLITIPTIFLFTFSVYKIFKSYIFTLIALFAFLFIIPWTSSQMFTIAHPFTLTYGTLMLAIFLFWQASGSSKKLYWVLAGLGIALVIYSQPYAAIILCTGIVFYQLLTRRYWKQFILMVITAFILTTPYTMPLIFVYHLQSRNTYQAQILPGIITSDNVFSGYGSVRFLNTFFILTGLLIGFFRKNRLDRLILPIFFIGELFLFLGFSRFMGENFGLPKIKLPEAFVWVDLWYASMIAVVLLFSIGISYWITKIAQSFHKDFEKTRFILVLFFLLFYGVLSLPLFVERSRDRYIETVTGKQYSSDWMKFTDWVNTNTTINDVFLGFPDPTAYVFVSGMTGRKTVSINNDHVNPFIDQPKRVRDTSFMYQTINLDEFKKLARQYKVSFVLVSPYENWDAWKEGLLKFSSDPFFTPVFTSGDVTVYKLNW